MRRLNLLLAVLFRTILRMHVNDGAYVRHPLTRNEYDGDYRMCRRRNKESFPLHRSGRLRPSSGTGSDGCARKLEQANENMKVSGKQYEVGLNCDRFYKLSRLFSSR